MGETERTRGGTFATKPFTRAPWLLLKSPAVFAALAGAAAILALVAASTPLYLSSAGSAALDREFRNRCPVSYALSFSAFAPEDTEREMLADAADAPRMLDPVYILEGSLGQARFDGRSQPLKLMYFTGFAEHLDVIEQIDGEGLWIGERLAGWLGVEPGDVISVTNGGVSTEIRMVALTTDLYDRRQEPAWCGFENLLKPTAMGDLPTPLVFIDHQLLSAEHRRAAFADYGPTGMSEQWLVPIDVDRITLDEATSITDAVVPLEENLQERMEASDTLPPESPYRRVSPAVHSDFAIVTDRIVALAAALQTSIDPLSTAVALTAIGLMGIAGSYWVDRRRPELRSLAVRGVSPAALGLKAGLESLLPVGVGTLVGWALAGPVVSLAGPQGAMSSEAFIAGGIRSLLAATLGLAATMVVAGIRARRVLDVVERPEHNRFGPVVPLAFLAATIWVRTRLGDSAVVLPDRQLVGSIDPLVVLYPMLAFATAALAGGYILVRIAPALARVGKRPSLFLAFRRISSAPMLATVLVVGAAIPVATLIYSATLTRSTTSTIDAKGRTFVGSDVSTVVYGYDSLPQGLQGKATVVGKVDRAGQTGSQVDILAVDPATFADGAFFDPSFASEPIQELLARLGPMDNGVVPAIVANGEIGNQVLDARGVDLPIEIVGYAESFPGAVRNRPLVVVSRTALEQAIELAGRRPATYRYFLWAGDVDETAVIDALRADQIGFAFTTPAERTLDLLKFQSVVWTFDFLELYAALAGLIAVGAILLYSDTRQRARNLAYALARRMGLTRSDHIKSSLMETAIPLLLGTMLGAVTALITARTVYSALDPVPETPPGPRWVPAFDLIAITLGIALVLSWATAWISQRAADTADTSELLRHGG